MDKYEQEIFNFLIVRENFEATLKVMGHFSMIKENLLNQFWNKVAMKVKERIQTFSEHWKVFNPNNKKSDIAKLIIYKDNWKRNEKDPFVGVAWEHLFGRPFYGVYNDIKSKNIDSAKLKAALEDIRTRLEFESDTNWWPIYRFGSLNFSNENNIGNILPDRQDNTVEEYTNNLLDLLPEVEKIIDNIIYSS